MNNREKFKEDIDITVEFIESCWDENNLNDGLTFDERLQKKINELSKNQKNILKDAQTFCEK